MKSRGIKPGASGLRGLVPWAAVVLLGLTACAGRGPSRETRLAIDLLKGTQFETLSPSIEFTRFSPFGSSATAEGKVTTAFRFEKEGGRWVLRDVRLGDTQWESVRDLQEALDQVRARRTRQDLQEILAALERYRAANGSYPPAADIVDLVDKLAPRYLSRVIRMDRWGHELRMMPDQGRPGVASDGPDGKAGTADDLRM